MNSLSPDTCGSFGATWSVRTLRQPRAFGRFTTARIRQRHSSVFWSEISSPLYLEAEEMSLWNLESSDLNRSLCFLLLSTLHFFLSNWRVDESFTGQLFLFTLHFLCFSTNLIVAFQFFFFLSVNFLFFPPNVAPCWPSSVMAVVWLFV